MKRYIKLTLIGVGIGLLLVALQGALHLDKDVFFRWVYVIATAIVLGSLLSNIVYNLSYFKKVKKALALLEDGRPQEYIAEMEKLLQTAKGWKLRELLTMDLIIGYLEDGRPQEYITEVEKLLQTARGHKMKALLTVNLAAGYADLKEFDRAITLLEGISDQEPVDSTAETAYRLNLCICYFRTARREQAIALYKDSQTVFESQRKSKLYGGNIASLDILAAIQMEEYGRAEELLDQARQMWKAPRLQKTFQEMEHTLIEIKKEQDQ